MGRPETVPTSVQCTIGSLNKSLNFLFDHVIPKSLAKTGRGNIWSKIKEQNPPRLSNGSVIAAPAGGAVTLSRLPFHISDRRRRGPGLSLTMALMAIGWVSWWPGQLTAPGVTCTGVNGHWDQPPSGLGLQTVHWAAAAFDSEIILSALLKSGPGSSCALRGREANSSFCLNHYRRYLCEIDTIRTEITNRFLKWVLCPYIILPNWQSKCFQCTLPLKFSRFSSTSLETISRCPSNILAASSLPTVH